MSGRPQRLRPRHDTVQDWIRLQRGLAAVLPRLRGEVSQEKAAEAAGLSIAVVQTTEGQKKAPSLRSLLALARSFGIRTSELIAKAEEYDRARPLSGRKRMLAVTTAPGSAPNVEALGRAARAQRELLGLTQSEVGERADGMHCNQVGEIERGETYPQLRTLVRLAGALELLPSELLSLGEKEHLASVEAAHAAAARRQRIGAS